MPRKAKAYLPRWTLRVVTPMLLLIWGLISWSAFCTTSGREELGLVGWLLITAVLGLVAVMMWLMASGRLPAYILEIDDDEPPGR